MNFEQRDRARIPSGYLLADGGTLWKGIFRVSEATDRRIPDCFCQDSEFRNQGSEDSCDAARREGRLLDGGPWALSRLRVLARAGTGHGLLPMTMPRFSWPRPLSPVSCPLPPLSFVKMTAFSYRPLGRDLPPRTIFHRKLTLVGNLPLRGDNLVWEGRKLFRTLLSPDHGRGLNQTNMLCGFFVVFASDPRGGEGRAVRKEGVRC